MFPIWDEVGPNALSDACCWFWFDGMMISVVLVGRGAPLKVRHCDDARCCIRYPDIDEKARSLLIFINGAEEENVAFNT